MIWRSTTALLCPDHRCEPEGDMKQTSRPVPDFQAFGLASCARRSGSQERPCHRLHRWGPSGVPAPAPLLTPGWESSGGRRRAALKAATRARLRSRDWGDRHPAGARGSGSGPAGRRAGARDSGPALPLQPLTARPIRLASRRTHPQGRVHGGSG